MRLAIVSHYYPPHVGGIEAVARHQAMSLAARGHDVAVLTSATPMPAGRQIEDGVDVHRLPAWNPAERRGVPFPVPNPIAFVRAARSLRGVDVVHAHDLLYPTTWLAALWCLLTGTRLVVHQHVAVVEHPSRVVVGVQRLFYATAGRLVLRIADRVVFLNSRVETMLRDLGAREESLEFLANGLDDELFRPCRDDDERRDVRARHGLPQDRVLAVFVARPVPKKGYAVLREALSSEFTLVTVGGHADSDGGQCPGDTVHLGSLGPVEVAEVMRACDVFVLPSVAEGFPLTVQEAMASGLPVVTTDDPGYDAYDLDRELVRLVAPEVETVRAALEEVSVDAQLRDAMASYATDYARRSFSWQRHADELERLYAAPAAQPVSQPVSQPVAQPVLVPALAGVPALEVSVPREVAVLAAQAA